MSYKDWYTFLETPNAFTCYIVDKDLEPVKQYTISKQPGNEAMCTCFAGHTWCRHKKMLVMFQEKKLVGSRKYYNFDRNKWMEPPKAAQEQET